MKPLKFSKISLLHYVKLVFRILLFLGFLLEYLYRRLYTNLTFRETLRIHAFFLPFIWIVFVAEMLLRFFPSPLESPGCQKQFARNFLPAPAKTDTPARSPSRGVLTVLAAWLALNGGIAALYFTHRIDEGILVLIALFYSISDMICILFFCPFQSWFMQNRCCTVCRIYNWDYIMMFTPMFFINTFYSLSLAFLSLLLFLRWEYTAFRHPERFDESRNAALRCANCPEKLCRHKEQLHRLWSRQLAKDRAGLSSVLTGKK